MPKLIITQACQVAFGEGTTHADVADQIDATKDDAATLTRMGRAMYLDRTDDPTKGSLTATKDDVDATKRHAKAIAAERAERADAAQAASPAGLAVLVAAQVAAAVQAALKPATPA